MLCPTGVGLPLLVPSHWACLVGPLCLACAVVVFVVGYIHHHALAGRPPQASDTYETFKYDGVLWSEVRIPHTTSTSSRPERLRHSQRKYFRISSDAPLAIRPGSAGARRGCRAARARCPRSGCGRAPGRSRGGTRTAPSSRSARP